MLRRVLRPARVVRIARATASTRLLLRRLHEATQSRKTELVSAAGQSEGGERSHSDESKEDARKARTNSRFKIALAFGGLAALAFGPAFAAKKHPNDKELARDLPHQVGKGVLYTWELEEGNIGHQALMFESISGERFYVSFWPSEADSGKVNFLPFKFVGLGGRFAKNIIDDIAEENGRVPANVAVIYNLDFTAMKKKCQGMKRDALRGSLCYTFFHNTPNILKYIDIASRRHPTISPFTIDPFSELPMPALQTATAPGKFHNCTSAVRVVLEAGKYPRKRDLLPYGSSPLGQFNDVQIIGAKTVKDAAKIDKLIEDASNIPEPKDEEVSATRQCKR